MLESPSASRGHSERPHQPNIVLFISDQQRTDTMASYGNPWIRSPHQDALAARSFLFENTYVTQPVCTPARGSLITGLYPHTHRCLVNRVKLADRFASLAEMLPDSYRSAHFGKWHLGDDSLPQHGFDEWVSTEDDHRDRYTRTGLPFSSYYYWMREQGIEPEDRCATGELIFSPDQRSKLDPEHQMAAYVAGHAERFVRANAARPWLLVFSTFEPHPPMHGPYNGLYDAEEIPSRPAFRAFPEGHSLFNRSRAAHHPNPRVPGESWRDDAHLLEQRANYYGNVKIIDDAVGRMVRALEESGQMERTIFAFTSDHGEMLGDHGMIGKRAFYDESARVPFLLSVPWLTRTQRRVEGVFGHADLVPTLLDLAGVALPDALQGRSLAGSLTGDLDLRRHAAFMEWNGIGDRDLGNPVTNLMATLPWRGIVTGDGWKLNLCAGDQSELFDLNDDPYEQSNRFTDAAQRDRVRELAARIRLWQVETADDAPLPAV